jgi:hypothetical protein
MQSGMRIRVLASLVPERSHRDARKLMNATRRRERRFCLQAAMPCLAFLDQLLGSLCTHHSSESPTWPSHHLFCSPNEPKIGTRSLLIVEDFFSLFLEVILERIP